VAPDAVNANAQLGEAAAASRKSPHAPVSRCCRLMHARAPPCAPMQLVDLFRSYFEGSLDEGSVKRNFTLIYELLDEAMDFGFPQVCVVGWVCRGWSVWSHLIWRWLAGWLTRGVVERGMQLERTPSDITAHT